MTDATTIDRPIAYTRAAWVALDPWDPQAYLRPSEFTHRLSPGDGPVAILDWYYGDISEHDGAGKISRAAKDLTGKFVRITVPDPALDGQEVPRFYGILTGEIDAPGQEDAENPTGNQRLIARGLEWILEHTPIDGSYIEDGASASKITRVLPFNVRTGRGITPSGNRSDAKVLSTTGSGLTSYVFSGDGAIWTARDIAEYYLAWFAPSEFGLDLAGLDANLAVFAGYVRPAKNVADGLNAIINPRRGHAWRVTVNTATEVASVTVTTVFDAAITVGGKTINPTADTTTVDPADYKGPENIQITKTADIKYGSVVARGSPILLMGTFDFTAANIEAGWSPGQETAYEAADEDARRAEEYDHVFRTFKVTATGLPAGPVCAADGTLSGTAKIMPHGKSFLRQLPMAIVDDDGEAPAGYRSPLVVIDVGGAGQWLPVDKLSQYEVPAVSMPVKILDGWPAFNIGASPNYMLGDNHYAPGATFKYQAIADYADIYATMAWYSDEIFSVTKSTGAGGYAGTLYIEVPEAQCWYRLAWTMVDADGDLVTEAAAAELRRDVDLLSGVAAMAAAWYGRNRSAIVLRKDLQCDFSIDPGVFITTIDFVERPAKTVNTLVTQVTQNFDNQTTIIKTDFKELDFSGIGRALNDNPNPGPRGAIGAPGEVGPAGAGNLGGERTAIQSPREARLLSAVHNDATADDVVRGDIITGVGTTPKWTRLAKGTNKQVVASDGTDVGWAALSALAVAADPIAFDAWYDVKGDEAWFDVDTRNWMGRWIRVAAGYCDAEGPAADAVWEDNGTVFHKEHWGAAWTAQDAFLWFYIYLTTNPAAAQEITKINGGDFDWYLRMNTDGKLQVKVDNWTERQSIRISIFAGPQVLHTDAVEIT